MMRGDSLEDGKDVVPPALNQLLGAAWIALFSGRWIVIPLLVAARFASPSLVADLDDTVLFRFYLMLVAVTILVVVLRLMRRTKKQLGTDALR
jgi:hypothetical protein